MRRLLPPFDLGWLLLLVVSQWLAASASIHVAPMRIPLGLATALIAPGYSLTAATLPDRTMRVSERLLMTLGLSLAVAAVSGLLIVAAGAEPSDLAWSTLILVVTAVASVVAVLREPNSPRWRMPPVRDHLLTIILLSSAAAIGAAGLVGASSFVRSQRGPAYSQLSLVPLSPTVARLSVASSEYGRQSYRVLLSSGNRTDLWRLVLSPSQTWSINVRFDGRRRARAVAWLYRPQDSAPYRTVYLASSKSRVNGG